MAGRSRSPLSPNLHAALGSSRFKSSSQRHPRGGASQKATTTIPMSCPRYRSVRLESLPASRGLQATSRVGIQTPEIAGTRLNSSRRPCPSDACRQSSGPTDPDVDNCERPNCVPQLGLQLPTLRRETPRDRQAFTVLTKDGWRSPVTALDARRQRRDDRRIAQRALAAMAFGAGGMDWLRHVLRNTPEDCIVESVSLTDLKGATPDLPVAQPTTLSCDQLKTARRSADDPRRSCCARIRLLITSRCPTSRSRRRLRCSPPLLTWRCHTEAPRW